jgi:hypothetical protein
LPRPDIRANRHPIMRRVLVALAILLGVVVIAVVAMPGCVES